MRSIDGRSMAIAHFAKSLILPRVILPRDWEHLATLAEARALRAAGRPKGRRREQRPQAFTGAKARAQHPRALRAVACWPCPGLEAWPFDVTAEAIDRWVASGAQALGDALMGDFAEPQP
jgi:hypothetical protein